METLSKSEPGTTNDETLIREFKSGSFEAFNVLYSRHLAGVINRVRFVVPAEDVEDVTQEVFMAALKSLQSFRGESQFSTWLRTLTNRKVAEYYRKRNRKQEAPVTNLSEAHAHKDGGQSVIMEDRLAIQHAMLKLPENYREIILLRFAEDMQFVEIARVTGNNIEAVKSTFRRAMTALRARLDE